MSGPDSLGPESIGDEDLMARVAAGDRAAFSQLAARHVDPGLRFARRTLGNAADAEEIVQEALLRVWVHAPRWQHRATFRAWFYRILVNLCLDRQRRPVPLALDAAGDPADPSADAVERLARKQRNRAVEAAIADLPERQRTALLLTFHEELSNAETAAVLGTSVSAVETLLIRAKRGLRKRLVGDGNGSGGGNGDDIE